MTASGYSLDNLFTGECCCVLCQEDQKSIWTSGLFGFYSLSSWQVACNCLVDDLWLFCTSFLLPIMVYVDYCWLNDEDLAGEPSVSRWFFHDFLFRPLTNWVNSIGWNLWIRCRRWSLSSRCRGHWVGIQPVNLPVEPTDRRTMRLGKCLFYLIFSINWEVLQSFYRFWLQFPIGICGLFPIDLRIGKDFFALGLGWSPFSTTTVYHNGNPPRGSKCPR